MNQTTKLISAAYHISAVTARNDLFEATALLSDTQFIKLTGETKASWRDYISNLSQIEIKGLRKQFSVKLDIENKRVNSYYFSRNDQYKS
jgi:hypothetical protein